MVSSNKISDILKRTANPFRLVYLFCSRFLVVLIAFSLAYRFSGKPLSVNTDDTSTFGAVLIFLVCILLTSLWSWYISKTELPLMLRRINSKTKMRLIIQRVLLIFVFSGLRDSLRESLVKDGTTIIRVFGDMYFSISVFVFLISLIAVIFKKTAKMNYRKR